ncbi:hypothetical protein A2U01_0024251, partial [Trifolium medium]|nr:hypothetical protein [Trifolium medium]
RTVAATTTIGRSIANGVKSGGHVLVFEFDDPDMLETGGKIFVVLF